jgi:hypothetical protein
LPCWHGSRPSSSATWTNGTARSRWCVACRNFYSASCCTSHSAITGSGSGLIAMLPLSPSLRLPGVLAFRRARSADRFALCCTRSFGREQYWRFRQAREYRTADLARGNLLFALSDARLHPVRHQQWLGRVRHSAPRRPVQRRVACPDDANARVMHLLRQRYVFRHRNRLATALAGSPGRRAKSANPPCVRVAAGVSTFAFDQRQL